MARRAKEPPDKYGGRGCVTSADRVRRIEEDTPIWRLRLNGLSLPEINEQTGIPVSTIHQRIQKRIKQAQENIKDQAMDWLTLEISRLERLRSRLSVFVDPVEELATGPSNAELPRDLESCHQMILELQDHIRALAQDLARGLSVKDICRAAEVMLKTSSQLQDLMGLKAPQKVEVAGTVRIDGELRLTMEKTADLLANLDDSDLSLLEEMDRRVSVATSAPDSATAN